MHARKGYHKSATLPWSGPIFVKLRKNIRKAVLVSSLCEMDYFLGGFKVQFCRLFFSKSWNILFRELKRLCTITRSPIYAHFSETLSGLMTIRAFRQADRFTGENEKRLELNQRANYCCKNFGLSFNINLLQHIFLYSPETYLAPFEIFLIEPCC